MCKTQQEFIAEDNLKRQGFTVYLPTAPNKSRKQGRVTTDIKAMFPGYLFIEADWSIRPLSYSFYAWLYSIFAPRSAAGSGAESSYGIDQRS